MLPFDPSPALEPAREGPTPHANAAPSPSHTAAVPAQLPATPLRQSALETSSHPPLADQTARDRIRSDLRTTLLVEAAAGTGKTSELVRRIVATLVAGEARLDGIVAVTFTEAAAGELKLRLRAAIEEARQDPASAANARERMNAALEQLEEARIGTIHSFAADLLRERPVEAGVDPRFEVAPEEAAADLFDRAFDRWFETQLASPGPAVRRLLRRRPRDLRRLLRRGSGDESPRRLLRQAAWDLAEHRDFPAPWRRDPGFERDPGIDALVDEILALGAHAAAGDPEDYFTRSLVEIDRFGREVTRMEAVRGRDHDGLEASLTEFRREKHWAWKGWRRFPPGFPKNELLARRDELKRRLDDFVTATGSDLAPALRDELWPVIEAYERLKERAGCLDFLDLLLRARNLVRDHALVRRSLQVRFTHLFVDEFQDTDPLQVELLFLLAADDPAATDWRRARPAAGKLFLVGDPKQSIYRFRRADVALYEEVKRRLIAAGGAVVDLSVSFRSVPAIQQAVNAAFAPRMTGATAGEPRYVPLAPFRSGLESQPAVVALPVPAPYGDYGKIVKWKIDESLPDAVASFVDWLARASGWIVTESGSVERVPLRPRHVCLLFRRFRSGFTDVTRPYVRALEARQLPHLLVGGSSFHVREEIEAIRNALLAIERPEDELSVYATLKGPLFALRDGELLAFRERLGSLHPFRRIPEDLPTSLLEVSEALGVLRGLHRGRNHRSIADTIGLLLTITRAHAAFAIWPTGEQALANVTRLMDVARRAERRGVTSFRAFVDRLADEAERGEAGDAPIVEENTEGVRIMTVHRAKGLEFPVVILADLTASETPREASRFVAPEHGLCALRLAGCLPPDLLDHRAEEMIREREEATRLLYVAATRARDLLVVSAVGDERHSGWLTDLEPAIYPTEECAGEPEDREPPGCPAFGFESVPGRPEEVARPARSVVPGLHPPERGEHRVVWWDPTTLELDVRESVGLKQRKLLEADEGGERSEAGLRAHAAWRAERFRVREGAARPCLAVATATERTAVDGEPSVEVVVESIERTGVRPRGRRFGTLVHALLAAVEFRADGETLRARSAFHGRFYGATEEEIEAATGTVRRVLAHPLLARAAAAADAGRCRREVPLTHRDPDGTLVESVADITFLETEGEPIWTVVDFKTDAELGGRLDRYRRQVGLYAEAIVRATGAKTRAVLLRV